MDIWWKYLDWLQNIEKWLTQIEIKANEESEKEANLIKEVMCTAIDDKSKSEHHTSNCDQTKKLLIATGEGPVTYPVVVVEVNGILCRALLDTGVGSSYVSSTLVKELNITPKRKEVKTIEMMLHTTTKKVEVFEIQIQDVASNFDFTTEVRKVEKDILINIPNPQYEAMIN